MADIEDPPRSRWPGVVVGLLVAAPFGLGLALMFLPSLYGQIMGGVGAFDAQLRIDDDYMKTLCVDALDVSRDEELCTCALAAEFPSLDCQIQLGMLKIRSQNNWRQGMNPKPNLLTQVAAALPGLSKSETKVAQAILADPEAATQSSIANLAKSAGVSEPSVNRFSKRFGAKGFPDFKIQLATSLVSGVRLTKPQ